eukprot:1160644-Pelagomonas_calceolata.AAC.7
MESKFCEVCPAYSETLSRLRSPPVKTAARIKSSAIESLIQRTNSLFNALISILAPVTGAKL